MVVDDELPSFLERYGEIRCSPLYADRAIGKAEGLLQVLRVFRDSMGVRFLEQFELAEICRTPSGTDRIHIIARIISHHLGGGFFAQRCPSGRPVPIFIDGPGSENWPSEMDNTKTGLRLGRQSGIISE
jgi:hypothetical protein